MNEVRQDIAFSLRLWRKSPWLSATAALLLTLGIGANTAVFSLLDAALLRPLPYPEVERLVQVEQDQQVEVSQEFSEEKFLFWRAGSRAFAAMAAYEEIAHRFALRGEGRPQLVAGLRTTRDLFNVLGVAPVLGRGFTADEDRPGGPPVAVLSQRLWQRLFAGDPAVLGRQIDLEGVRYTLVGVMPGGFRFPASAEVWLPLRLDPGSRQHAQMLLVTARLSRGVSMARAEHELQAINRRYLTAQGGGTSRERAYLQSFDAFLRGAYRPPLLLALAAVGLVLLIACANIANLQLARFTARQREIGIRASLGASSRRILRQLLTESMLLALVGGGLGLALCAALLPSLRALAPPDLAFFPAGEPALLDAKVFSFALAVSLAVGFLAGIAPALNASAPGLQQSLAEGATGAGSSGGRRGQQMRHSLVTAETALAMTLLISAGLLIKSFAGLLATDPGFKSDHLLTAKIALPPSPYGQPGALERFEREIVPEVAALPGVRRAALATNLPFEPGAAMTFIIAGRHAEGSREEVGLAEYRAVSPGYFDTLGIPRRRGRPFQAGDLAKAPGVLILNETAAKKFFPGQQALGQRIDIGLPDMPQQADPAPRQVIGIVADVREKDLAHPPPPILYVPLAQVPPSLSALLLQALPLCLVVETAGDPSSVARATRERVWSRQPNLPVTDVVPMESILSRSLAPARFQTLLIGCLGAMALLLSALGIYGVLAYLVTQRTREIGIRTALGSRPRAIELLVVRQGMAPALLGIGLGIFAALGTSRLLSGFVVGISTTDRGIFVGAPLLLAVVALLATYLPARRASRVDPVRALSHQ